MQTSLPTETADQNIKAVDLAKFAEIAKIVDVIGGGQSNTPIVLSLALKRAG
jgi:hypothetical protein